MTDVPLLPIVVDEFPPDRRSMRIAVVTETYPPEVNGVALSLARVVEGLRARQHAVQLVRPRQPAGEVPGSDGRFDEVLTRGLPIPNYPHLTMGLPCKRALVRLWQLHRPDVVHIATEGPLGWSALKAASYLRLPVCSDFRTNFHAYSRLYGVGWLNKPILAYLRRFHNATRHTMVPTEALRQELSVLGFRNLSVLARGVDTALFHPSRRSTALRARWGAGDDTTVVVCVGRLAVEKNLGLLFTAFDAMRVADPSARLVLVGDGPLRGELERRHPQAVFAGMRSGEDLAAHYASGDVFLFPSTTETYGNVTPEAMASGLAVLAYDHAAAAQLIKSWESGLLARLGDATDFTRLAVRLAADRPLARRLGLGARECACRHGWDGIAGQIESVLVSTIDGSAERPYLPARHLPA
ncbi:glycosyltransferase family 1 protein [Ideonella sp. A 288]|uniref:glycosyltransferase family 4 protein n=1 Tax=Ideonella sp. A 288 TaxID=1962181 RepID=UPI000B4B0A1F|nr:glycosyltransferase family 1 protein [Ideonella sp. A 288]